MITEFETQATEKDLTGKQNKTKQKVIQQLYSTI